MAFLLQGNHAGGLEASMRTFVVSGVIVAVFGLFLFDSWTFDN